MKIKILNDVFDIAKRIAEIDNDYEVVYNTKTCHFEVLKHNRVQVVLPYNTLDCRALLHVRKTRIERINKILKEIEENNLKLVASNEKRIVDMCGYKTKNLVNYLSHGGHELPSFEEI